MVLDPEGLIPSLGGLAVQGMAQVTVDAHDNFEPVPGSPWGLVSGVFTQWDGLWYLEIVRNGYPTSIPPNINYFQLEARAAFFPQITVNPTTCVRCWSASLMKADWMNSRQTMRGK